MGTRQESGLVRGGGKQMVTRNLKTRRTTTERRRGRPRVFLDNLMAVGLPLFVMVFAFTIAVGARQVQRSTNWAKSEHGERRLMTGAVSPRSFRIVMPSETSLLGAAAFDNEALAGQEQFLSSSSSGPLTNDTETKTVQQEKLKSEECEMSYNVLPCSTNVVGNLFLMWAFGTILLTAARFISEGSELLLELAKA
ncbi:hypothetical protein CBR_g34883 [Chara braunii]|uniref:Uncharacterized protein n=1 Tax=Chara braunii TaxID=69332 RepID=A0A388LJK9_CHABU|nr:hypothetical protein CBR_g34883 [Chara braunii]|eukprot:GBG82506.1 hypothetical protein CBR_g34883 [Chara braunii]